MQNGRNRVDHNDFVIVIFKLLGALDALCDKLCNFKRCERCAAEVQETEFGRVRLKVTFFAKQKETVQEHGLGEFQVDVLNIVFVCRVFAVANGKRHVHKRKRLSAFRWGCEQEKFTSAEHVSDNGNVFFRGFFAIASKFYKRLSVK